MKYTDSLGMKISQFSLGTVQLGLSYGVANDSGKPSREQAHELLRCAVEGGVNSIDTAAAYGDSEEVIGSFLEDCPETERLLITTKIADFDHSSEQALERSIREKTAEGKRRLGLPQIPILMLHHSKDFTENPEGVLRVLEALRAEGEVRRIGISLYEEDDFAQVAASSFDAVQIPQNIFDWRLITSGKLSALTEAKKIIFVRSVFLQGLVFKTPDTLSETMAFCAPALQKFRTFCERYQMSPAALAASFVLSLPGVTSLVLGCETVEQVRQNLTLIEQTSTLSETQMGELRAAFEHTDPRVLDPRQWNA